jgi:ADP-ribose pyrophosphatase YjhB (NUDIX family)
LDRLVVAVQDSLTDDLRDHGCRGDENHLACHCYVASEALYHLLGGKKSGWTPMTVRHEGDQHWFLRHEDGLVLDATDSQFQRPVPVHKARGKGFLTKRPSKRAQVVIKRAKAELPGGVAMRRNRVKRTLGLKASKRSPRDFDQRQLSIGTRIELEHTDDRAVAQQIAMHHLEEYPDYYRALVKMEKALERKKRLTARALVVNGQGRVLSVVQGGDPGNLLMPGGGVERGETVAQGAARELHEETGLVASSLVPLIVVEDRTRHTVYFVVDARGTLRASGEGPLRWCSPRELVETRRGGHHRAVLEAAGLPY